jgi:hypothetical protein
MNVSNQAKSVSTSFVERVAPIVSPQVQQVITLGRQQGWNCSVLGQAPFPSEPVRLEDWLIVPAHQDSSPVPDRALGRVQAIFAAGLRPKGFIVVHEAPMLLPAPAQNQTDTLQMSALPDRHRSVLKVASAGLGVLGTLLVAVSGLAILAMAAISLAALLVVPATLAVGAAVVDPILVAVTEDEYWIEIDRWWS